MAGQATRHRTRRRVSRAGLHVFLSVMAFIFAWPLIYVVYLSLRPAADWISNANGPFSLPAHGVSSLSLDNYTYLINNADLLTYFWNTVIITVPAVILTLWISSMIAFGISKYSWKLNLLVLMIFTAGNLLPSQVIVIPLVRLYYAIPLFAPLSDNGKLFDQTIGVILIHVTFQTGFCTFVLSNYMKTLPKELNEAAMMDGAGVWTIYRKVILPLCTPAIAALAVLESTWIYNDFFWSLFLFTSGAKRPMTAALNNLNGTFFVDQSHLAALSVMAAIPTVLIYLVLQRYFVRGLTLGAAKG
jgi:multiple sugar transport system permease protein